jgi:group I intron endonuclease
MERISGVYKILNRVTNKIYVGSSINIFSRWKKHKTDLVYNRHGNIHLQRSWNKYGESNFAFSIIENCSNFLEREQYYLDTLLYAQDYISGVSDKFKEVGYNISPIAAGGKYSRVYQYSRDGSFIKFWNSSIEAGEFVRCSYKSIWKCCNTPGSLCKNFIWSYTFKESMSPILISRKSKKNFKRVVKMDMRGNVIGEFESMDDGALSIGQRKSTNIRKCIMGERSHSGGFRWKYAE